MGTFIFFFTFHISTLSRAACSLTPRNVGGCLGGSQSAFGMKTRELKRAVSVTR